MFLRWIKPFLKSEKQLKYPICKTYFPLIYLQPIPEGQIG